MKRCTRAAKTKDTTVRTYAYKLRPNRPFIAACERELEHSRQIYNAALQERIECYRMTGVSLGFVEQSRHLTDARTLPDVKVHLRTIQSDALERVDEAFKAFFKRCAKGAGKAGFPPFGKVVSQIFYIRLERSGASSSAKPSGFGWSIRAEER